MKRSAALASLSRDHHQALVVAQQLRRATEATAAEARAAFLDYWTGHGHLHFRLEEELLFPAYAGHGDPHDPVVLRALGEHATIRHRAEVLPPLSPPTPTRSSSSAPRWPRTYAWRSARCSRSSSASCRSASSTPWPGRSKTRSRRHDAGSEPRRTSRHGRLAPSLRSRAPQQVSVAPGRERAPLLRSGASNPRAADSDSPLISPREQRETDARSEMW